MKKFLKMFPLTIYLISAFIVLVFIFTYAESNHDNNSFLDKFLSLLALPFLPMLWLHNFLSFKEFKIGFIILFTFILDLLIIYIRKYLSQKNKNQCLAKKID